MPRTPKDQGSKGRAPAGPDAALVITPNFFQNQISWATYGELLAGGVTLDMISGLLIPVPADGVFQHVFHDAGGI